MRYRQKNLWGEILSIKDSISIEFNKLRVSIMIEISSLNSSCSPVSALKDSNSYKHGILSAREQLDYENLALSGAREGRGSEDLRLGRICV